MSTVNTGLAALNQAVTDETTAVATLATAAQAIEAGLATVLADLQAAAVGTDPDSAVATAAAALEAQITVLDTVTTALNAAAATVPSTPAA